MSPRSARLLRSTAWIAGGFALWLAFGFLAVPPIAKQVAETRLSDRLKRDTRIEQVRFNPLTFVATASGIEIGEPGATGTFFRIDAVRIDVEAWRSLFSWGAVIREARFERPQLSVVRHEDGRYNFSDLLARDGPASEPGSGRAGPPRFSISNIQILDASVTFEDRAAGEVHVADEILLGVPFISSLPVHADIFVEPAFQARLNGTPVALEARTRPFRETRDTGVDIELEELDLTRFLGYAPVELPLRIESARLAGRFHVDFRRDPAGPDLLEITGRARLRELATNEQDGKPLLAADAIDIDIASLQPIARSIHIGAVRGEGVQAHLRRAHSGALNVTRLLPEANPREGTAPRARTDLRIDEIAVANGRIAFSDDSVHPRFARTYENVALSIGTIDSVARAPVPLALEATVRTGERITHRGEIALEPAGFSGELRAAGVQARHYEAYYAPYVRFSTRSGTLDIHAKYALAPRAGKLAGHIDLAAIDLRDGRLSARGSEDAFMSVTRGRLEGPKIDFDRKRVQFRRIVAQGGEIFVHLDPQRRVNLATYFTREDPDGGDNATDSNDSPWIVEFGTVKGDNATIRFRDEGAPVPAEFSATSVSASARGLSTARNTAGRLEARLEAGGGSATAGGTLTLVPFSMALDLDVRDTDVLPSLPYFADRFNLDIRSRRASFDGRLSVGKGDNAGAGQIEGNVNITRFDSADPVTGEDLLSWSSLYLSGFRAAWLPAAVSFDEIALSNFYSRLIVRPDGTFNVQDVIVRPEQSVDGENHADGTPPPIRINRITLQGGTVDFSDRFIQPNYSATLVDIGGTVVGLSSEPGTLADVDLRGRLDTGAPTAISGRVNPLAGDLAMDLRGDVRGIELSRLSPYSTKYLGYGIERGTLSFRARYQVEQRELRAENQVTLNQLVFGERVESPDAIRVPVQLALSLLKDRNGVIDVNVPISGTIDDPEFSVGGIVMRIILNMMRRAITSPFTFLANLVGAREELSHVDFEPGRSRLGADARERLDSLAQALAQRPALGLAVEGRHDPDTDTEGLRRARLERKVRAQKAAELRGQGIDPGAPEEIEIAPEEYERWLRRAYLAEPFPKPRDARGQELELPVDEMEKLMFANLPIGEDDLIALAERRADESKRYLVQQGVEADRVAISAARRLSADARPEERATRAEFRLR